MPAVQMVTRAVFSAQKARSVVERKQKRSLMRQGAIVRTFAKRSIRRRKNPKINSQPGSPPYQHTRRGLADIKRIYFAADGKARVIVGMAGLPRTGMQVPRGYELGGNYRRRGVRVRVAARPVTGPATDRAIKSPRFMKVWQE